MYVCDNAFILHYSVLSKTASA